MGLPENWHFPVAYREVAPGPDGRMWVWRKGLNWSSYGPEGEVVTIAFSGRPKIAGTKPSGIFFDDFGP